MNIRKQDFWFGMKHRNSESSEIQRLMTIFLNLCFI